jgi:hypothetical protein
MAIEAEARSAIEYAERLLIMAEKVSTLSLPEERSQ